MEALEAKWRPLEPDGLVGFSERTGLFSLGTRRDGL